MATSRIIVISKNRLNNSCGWKPNNNNNNFQKDYYISNKSFCLPNLLLNCESRDPHWLRHYRSTKSFSTKPCLFLPLPSQGYNTGCSKVKWMALIFKLWCLNLTQFYLHPISVFSSGFQSPADTTLQLVKKKKPPESFRKWQRTTKLKCLWGPLKMLMRYSAGLAK